MKKVSNTAKNTTGNIISADHKTYLKDFAELALVLSYEDVGLAVFHNVVTGIFGKGKFANKVNFKASTLTTVS